MYGIAGSRAPFCGAVFLLLSVCTPSSPAQHEPARGADGWPTASPVDVDLDPAPFEALREEIRANPQWNLHAVLVVRSGQLVVEQYFEGRDQDWGRDLGSVRFDRETLHDLRSVSKSVTGSLLGVAMSQDKVPGLDTPLPGLFPEHAEILTDAHAGVLLRHLLTMSAGMEWDESLPYSDPRNSEIQMIRSGDPVKFVLSCPVVEEPGTRYRYSGGNTALLAALVERGMGKKLDDVAREVLFRPLGIRRFDWHRHASGHVSAASGLRLLPRDLAKYGYLHVAGGKWKDQQVLPANWVRESCKVATNPGWTVGYGFQWFVERYQVSGEERTIEVPTCVGNGGQKVFVVRELDLVVVVLAGNYNTRDPELLGLGEKILTQTVFPAAGLKGARFVVGGDR